MVMDLRVKKEECIGMNSGLSLEQHGLLDFSL